ncbi:hypothetical protein OSG_eHP25_00155, partial [environmental Halophage eHP-25]
SGDWDALSGKPFEGIGSYLSVSGDLLQANLGDGLQGDGSDQITVDVSAFAGDGLRDDGAENLAVDVSAFAGGGLTDGGSEDLAVDSTVARTDQTETFTQDVTVQGDLTVNGTEFITNTETVDVTDNLLFLNRGETGNGVTNGIVGFEADRGTQPPVKLIFNESDDNGRIGVEYKTISYSSINNGPFQVHEEIVGQTSGATAYLWEVDSTNNNLRTKGRTSTFDTGETIEGTDSGATAKVDSVSQYDQTQRLAPMADSPTAGDLMEWNGSAGELQASGYGTDDFGAVAENETITGQWTFDDDLKVGSDNIWVGRDFDNHYKPEVDNLTWEGTNHALIGAKNNIFYAADSNLNPSARHVFGFGSMDPGNSDWDTTMQLFEGGGMRLQAEDAFLQFWDDGGGSPQHVWKIGENASNFIIEYSSDNSNYDQWLKMVRGQGYTTKNLPIESADYASGFTGSGYKLGQETEVSSLSVRGTLLAREFEIRKLRMSKGPRADTVGGGKISEITSGTDSDPVEQDGNGWAYVDVVFEEEHGFKSFGDGDTNQKDLVLSIETDPSKAQESGSGSQGYAITREFRAHVHQTPTPKKARLYLSTDNTYVTPSTYENSRFSLPQVGDDVVVVGSQYNDRDSMLWYDPYGPFVDVIDEIDNWTEWENRTPEVRMGYISGAPDLPSGTSPSGYGMYGENVYLTGHIESTSGRIAGWNLSNKQLKTGVNNGDQTVRAGDDVFGLDGESGFGVQDNVSNERIVLVANQSNNFVELRGGPYSDPLFQLGTNTNQIAGWTFNASSLFRNIGGFNVGIGKLDRQISGSHHGFSIEDDSDGRRVGLWAVENSNQMGLQAYESSNNEVVIGKDYRGLFNGIGMRVRANGKEIFQVGESGTAYVDNLEVRSNASVQGDAVVDGTLTASKIEAGVGVAENLFPNPTLEGSFTDHIGEATVVDIGSAAYEGSHVIDCTGLDQYKDVWDIGQGTSIPPTQTGEWYTLGFWAKNTTSSDIEIGYAESGGWLKITIPSGTSNWTFFRVISQAESTGSNRMEVRNQVPTDGNLYLDNITLVRGKLNLNGETVGNNVVGKATVEEAAIVTSKLAANAVKADKVDTQDLYSVNAQVTGTLTIGDGSGNGVLKSQNYDGSQGWRIKGDTATFENGTFRGTINAEGGSLSDLQVQGQLTFPSTYDSSQIRIGSGSNAFFVGDFSLSGSGQGSDSLQISASATDSSTDGNATTRGGQDDYNETDIGGSSVTVDVDWSSNADSGDNNRFEDPRDFSTSVDITVYVRERDAGTLVQERSKSPAATLNDSGSVSFSFTADSSTDEIEVETKLSAYMGQDEEFYNSVSISNGDADVDWTNEQDFVGPDGAIWRDDGETRVKIDGGFANGATDDRIVVQEGRVTIRDQNGNDVISIQSNGLIVFHQKRNHPDQEAMDYGQGAIYAYDVGGGNVNLGWTEDSGHSDSTF